MRLLSRSSPAALPASHIRSSASPYATWKSRTRWSAAISRWRRADVGVDCNSERFVCDKDDTCDVADGETCASCSEDCGSCGQDTCEDYGDCGDDRGGVCD